MPRTARDQSATGIYHVMIRGINRQDIFEAPEDYRKFIETLASLREVVSDDMQTKICTCHIYAYCIMPNHVHILIHEKGWTISQCVKYIADIYVRYYNKKYGRIGHLLQDRFKSEPCNDSDYFIVLMRYIHQNPVKAGLAKTAKEYCYSSWGNDYLGLGDLHVCRGAMGSGTFAPTDILRRLCPRDYSPRDYFRPQKLHVVIYVKVCGLF